MAVNVEVTKTGAESGTNLIRRFSKRVQGAGIVPRVRGIRYFSRPQSKTSRKKHALRKIARRETVLELIKQGKLAERAPRTHHRR
jgi:ribosomal protein S21